MPTTAVVSIAVMIHPVGSIGVPWPQETNRKKQHDRKMIDSKDAVCPYVRGFSGRIWREREVGGCHSGRISMCRGGCSVRRCRYKCVKRRRGV